MAMSSHDEMKPNSLKTEVRSVNEILNDIEKTVQNIKNEKLLHPDLLRPVTTATEELRRNNGELKQVEGVSEAIRNQILNPMTNQLKRLNYYGVKSMVITVVAAIVTFIAAIVTFSDMRENSNQVLTTVQNQNGAVMLMGSGTVGEFLTCTGAIENLHYYLRREPQPDLCMPFESFSVQTSYYEMGSLEALGVLLEGDNFGKGVVSVKYPILALASGGYSLLEENKGWLKKQAFEHPHLLGIKIATGDPFIVTWKGIDIGGEPSEIKTDVFQTLLNDCAAQKNGFEDCEILTPSLGSATRALFKTKAGIDIPLVNVRACDIRQERPSTNKWIAIGSAVLYRRTIEYMNRANVSSTEYVHEAQIASIEEDGILRRDLYIFGRLAASGEIASGYRIPNPSCRFLHGLADVLQRNASSASFFDKNLKVYLEGLKKLPPDCSFTPTNKAPIILK